MTGCPSGEVPNSPFQCSGMYKIYIVSRLLLSRAENKGSHGSCSPNCDLSQKSVVMIRTEWICRVSSRKNKVCERSILKIVGCKVPHKSLGDVDFCTSLIICELSHHSCVTFLVFCPMYSVLKLHTGMHYPIYDV